MQHTVIQIEDTPANPVHVSRTLLNHLRTLISRTFKEDNKSINFITNVANTLKERLDVCLESTEPDFIITQYLLSQMEAVRDTNLKVEHATSIICQFFKHLRVTMHPAIQMQFEQLIKRIMEPQGEFVLVPNLWKQSTLTYDCYCGNQRAQDDCQQQLCYKCGRRCHTECFWPREKTQKYFQCAVCFLTNCLPHKMVDEIFYLGYLESDIRDKVDYKIKFYIDMNRENISNIEIRCLRLNKQSRFEITFPQNCVLHISGKNIKQFESLPSTSPLKRRNDEQVHLDKYLLTYLNTLFVKERHTYSQKLNCSQLDNHLIMVVSTKPTFIPRYLKQKFMMQRLSYKESKQTLKDYMDKSSGECQIEKLNVSLRCQYYLTHIVVPVRSKQCTTHYQPFDLTNFIQASLNAKSSVQSWLCPICKKRAYDLIVDEYLMSIIEMYGNLTQITFNREGEFIAIEKQNSIADLQQNTLNNQSLAIIDNMRKQHLKEADTIEIDGYNGKEVQQSTTDMQMPHDKGEQNERQIVFAQPVERNKEIWVISIDDSEQEEKKSQQLIFKRTFQDRSLDDQSLTQVIRKIPPKQINQNQPLNKQHLVKGQNHIIQDKTKNQMQIEQSPSKSTQLESMKDKLKSMLSAKADKLSQTLPAKTVTNQVNRLRNSTEIVIQQQVVQDVNRKQKEQSLIQQQRALLQQVKKQVKKGIMTSFDQTTFNMICRQLNNFKLIN